MHKIVFTDMVSENWVHEVPYQKTLPRIGEVVKLEDGTGVVFTVIHHYGKSHPTDFDDTLLHVEVVLNWRTEE